MKLTEASEPSPHERENDFGGEDFIEIPTWFFMLSHHNLSELDHCLCISRGSKKLPIALCARCTGAVIGFVLSLFFFGWFQIASEFYLDIIAFLFPLPAIIDWGTQTLTPRKSHNVIRVPTGILYGFAILPAVYYLSSNLFRLSLSTLKPLAAFVVYFTLVWLIGRGKLRERP